MKDYIMSSKSFEVGEIVGYPHYPKPSTNNWKQKEKPNSQYGDVWELISYNALVLPYNLAGKKGCISFANIISENKLSGMKRLSDRFLYWKVRLRSLTNDKYVMVDEDELYKNPKINTEVINNKLIEKNRKDKIKELLSL